MTSPMPFAELDDRGREVLSFVPDDVEHLRDAVIDSVGDLQADQRLKRSFFQTAELPL